MLLSTLLPQLTACLLLASFTNLLVLGRPFNPVLDLGDQHGRAGLGHSAPTLMDLDPQQSKSAAQVSSGD